MWSITYFKYEVCYNTNDDKQVIHEKILFLNLKYTIKCVQIWASQTFLTLAYCGRKYFDQFEAKSNKQVCYDLE